MTALRRNMVRMWVAVAAAPSLLLAVPVAAQNADAPIDVTAAPPPTAGDVGPSQLRDFNLNGTVTRPADQPAATRPAPAPRAATPTATTARPAPRTTPGVTTPQASAPRANAAAPTATLPLPSLSEPLGASGVAPALPREITTPAASAALTAEPSGFSPWPWAVALLALLGGGAYLLRHRRARRSGYADFDRLAFTGPAEGLTELPRATPKPKPATGADAPAPWQTPRPKPAAEPAPDWPTAKKPAPAPRPDPVPGRAPRTAGDGGIVSTRLKPELNVEFVPDRAVVTEREVMLQFDLTIINSGSAPARDVLVEGQLVTAHAAQDAEIAGFFAAEAGSGDRMALIPPLGRISLKSAVRLPLDQLHSFEVEGRRLFVPLVALNIFFRSGSGEGQASASYLVGRGTNEDEKLAPFRLDLGPRIFRGLSARPHSAGLQG
ncbi:MAG: hypothetical protein ABIP91_04515 [Sphingomicrobium sp.]